MRGIAAITALVLLGACGAVDGDIAAAKQAVAGELKDPDSAEFRNVRKVGAGTVCGEVNGRSLFGGYAGYRRFIAIWNGDGKPPFVAVEDPGSFAVLSRDYASFAKSCGDDGA
jgi:hypothetical protein